MATVTPSPCGVNASLEEAKAKIDELKAKISEGLDSIGDLGSVADTIKAKLSEVNVPKVENFNLQAELAKLPYLSAEEYDAAVTKLKNFFGKTVDNLDDLIAKIPKPPSLAGGETNLFEKLQNLAANIQTTTQDIIDSLSTENIAAAIDDLCKEVPNIESKIPDVQIILQKDDDGNLILDENGLPKIIVIDGTQNEDGDWVDDDGDVIQPVTDEAGNPVTDENNNPIPATKPAEKAAPPITPQENPKKETPPPPPPIGGFTFNFTREKFVAAAGPAAAAWYDAAKEVLPKYGITTPERVAGWIGQVKTETEFSTRNLEENLFYSAKGLFATFKKYFKTLEDALPFEKKPEQIANKVYANRYLNGNEASGDGYRYRGRGLKQLTFKANYLACSKDLYGDDRLVKNPDQVSKDKAVAIETSCWFWKKNNLSGFADKGDYKTLSIKVNGGTNGLDKRLKYTDDALKVLKT